VDFPEPDLPTMASLYLDDESTKAEKFLLMRMMFGGQTDEFDFHYFGWNLEFLKEYLFIAGFTKIERVKSFSIFNDTSDFAPYGAPISLNVIAYK
jgi:predicted SAM-dependent methyltransferase